MNPYVCMKEKGIVLPDAPKKGGLYERAKMAGETLVFLSGCGPVIDEPVTGKLGGSVSMQEGKVHAKNAMLNVIAALEAEIGDLNRVSNVVKIVCFVASESDFYEQPEVANSATQLLADIFGEKVGLPSRSAIGVNVLPGNIPVEIEAIFELRSGHVT